MASRRVVLVGLLVIALVALAGSADAGRGNGKPSPADPPEHAKAKGLTKHAEPEPVGPPASQPPAAAPPSAEAQEPVQAPTPAPVVSETPPRVEAATPPPAASVQAASFARSAPEPAPDPGPPTSTVPDLIVVTSPPSEAIIDSRSDAGGRATGATTTRVPGWAGEQQGAPTAPSEGPARWWVHLTWAVPVVGAGGLAAVLVARQRTRRPEGSAFARPRRDATRADGDSTSLRMAPVAPDDLKGILRNGHAAASRGAYADAVAWFERALALAPKLAVAHFCKGVCLAANGQVADAYGALRTACVVEPADASYRVHFARVALALGRHREAMDALEFVARAMPELGPAMLEDPQLAGLRDHPRFLMICGAL